jgi:hypothetical protein
MIPLVSALALLSLWITACGNPYEPEPPAVEEAHVLVRIAPDAARTILPSAQQLYYVLTFNDGTETVRENLGGALEKTVALSPGTWNLVVSGFRNAYEAEYGTAVASGNPAPFTVSASSNPVVEVALSASQSGTGTLRYTLTYPTNPAVSGGRIYLEQLGGPYKEFITLSISSSGNITAGLIPSLPWGYYQLNVYLYNGAAAIKSDLVHIYDNLDTEAALVFLAEDFAETADLSGLSSAIEAAKAAQLGVRTSADGSGISTGLKWAPQAAFDALNAAIADAETVITSYGSGLIQTLVESQITTLNSALNAFTTASGTGTYTPSAKVSLYVGASSSPESIGGGDTLVDALTWLQSNAQSNTAYTVVLRADEDLGPWILGGSGTEPNRVFSYLNNVSLTLKGETAERIIRLNAQGSLFTVSSYGSGDLTLILDENITLQGHADNNAPLLYVNSPYATVEMKTGSKITGNRNSSSSNNSLTYGGGVYVSSGTFMMNGGEISGNTSYSGGGGGGVSVINPSAFFTMNGGKISGNTAYSNNTGGGVFVLAGTFTMIDGEISGNIVNMPSPNYSQVGGGGVRVSNSGTFTMSGGKINGNTVNGGNYWYISGGGGVYIYDGTFILSGGEISGNTLTGINLANNNDNSYSGGSGVYVYRGAFVLQGNGKVALNNPVYLSNYQNFFALTIGSPLTGADPAALLEIAPDITWLGKSAIKWPFGQNGTLPVDRFSFTAPWELDADGNLQAKAASLDFGETKSAWLNREDVHFYRFTPTLNKSYTITFTRADIPNNYSNIGSISAAWADGSGTLASTNLDAYSHTTSVTSPSFVADKMQDIIIMVRSNNNYAAGPYTVKYNEQ